IELLAQRFQKQSEVLFVVGTVLDAWAGLSRILPVEIESVERVASDQRDRRGGEGTPGSVVESRIGKIVGSPSADRENDFQSRVLRLQCLEASEMRRSIRIVEHHLPVRIDRPECIVDVRDFVRADTVHVGVAIDVGDDSIAWPLWTGKYRPTRTGEDHAT